MLVGEQELRQLLNEVEHLRKQRDDLQRANNNEVERRRAAEAVMRVYWVDPDGEETKGPFRITRLEPENEMLVLVHIEDGGVVEALYHELVMEPQ